jgi:hypothetical protein
VADPERCSGLVYGVPLGHGEVNGARMGVSDEETDHLRAVEG